MANLKEVKGRIKSVISTQQITKAMKMVAAAKLRRSQDRILQMRPYAHRMGSIIANISASTESDLSTPFSEQRNADRVLLIIETSDRGLCGGFNSSVIKHTKALIAEKYSAQEASGNVFILPIGKKGFEHFNKRGYKVIKDFALIFDKLNFDKARDAAEFVLDGFLNREFDQVEIIYNEFKNVATQIVRNEQFLPVQKIETGQKASNIDYIFEPSKEELFAEIVPKYLKVQLYKTMLESQASENGARMTAMDKASENANELLKELRLTYNRTRQAAITKEILEIVGGAEALAQG
jgi:F-type H+-transporting ATPase subunit gamma